MLVLTEDAEHRLVLRTPHTGERVGLVFTVMGLFLVGTGLAILSETHLNRIAWGVSGTGAVLLAIGLIRIFAREVWIFDRLKWSLTHGFVWSRRRYNLRNVEAVELWRAYLGYRRLALRLENGHRVVLMAMPFNRDEHELRHVGRRIAIFLAVHMEERKII
jgi:hypothetical protein